MSKIKLLAWCDTPTGFTGFGRVAKEVLRTLYDTGQYDITIVGINQIETTYDTKKYPYEIIGNLDIISGEQLGLAELNRQIRTGKYDILFSINNLSNTATNASSMVFSF